MADLTEKTIENMRAAGKAGMLDTGNAAWDMLCDLALRSVRQEPVAAAKPVNGWLTVRVCPHKDIECRNLACAEHCQIDAAPPSASHEVRQEPVAEDVVVVMDCPEIGLWKGQWKDRCELCKLVSAPPSASAPEVRQEPVAWIEHHKGGDNLVWTETTLPCSPLYAAPPSASVEASIDQQVSRARKEMDAWPAGMKETVRLEGSASVEQARREALEEAAKRIHELRDGAVMSRYISSQECNGARSALLAAEIELRALAQGGKP